MPLPVGRTAVEGGVVPSNHLRFSGGTMIAAPAISRGDMLFRLAAQVDGAYMRFIG